MDPVTPHEAALWEKFPDDSVRCGLCRHECRIEPGQVGLCRVRRNEGGRLVAQTYGRLIAAAVDPIEKKPLYHVLPGSTSMSIASVGCNFRCKFCQNWKISQADLSASPGGRDEAEIAPEQVVASAVRAGCRSISYTYTEPTVFFEYACDTARLARQAGLKNCFVTNGFMSRAAVEAVAPLLDAANVDLKAFNARTYAQVMGGRLEGVLECLRDLRRAGVWLEVTTLIVPGMNDDPAELEALAGFIADELGPQTPWHISRYHDDYQFDGRGATPAETLAAAAEIGRRAGLYYVYRGNIAGEGFGDTICPACGQVAIRRSTMGLRELHLTKGRCAHCGQDIPGLWE